MNPLRVWNAFWFGPVSARPLGAFRVVLGLLVLAHLGLLTFDLDYWLTDAGMLRGDEARLLAGPLRPSPLHWVQDPVSVRLFFTLTATLAAAFTVGWRTRVVSVLLYLSLLSIHHRNTFLNCGPDNLLLLLVFYLMFAPCGAAYSLDALREARRRGTAAEPLIVPWAQRLVQINLCIIYFDSAVLKCSGPTWLNGTALHYVISNPELAGRLNLLWLTEYPLALNFITYMGLFTEFALAFWLWFRSTRPWVIAAGLMLHGGIILSINIPLFGELMTACYLTFLTPAELDRLLGVLNPRAWLTRSQTFRESIQ